MKRYFYIFFLLFYNAVYGQAQLGEYIVESSFSIKAPNSNYGDGCKNQVSVKIIFDKGEKTILNQDLNGASSRYYQTFEGIPHRVKATWVPLRFETTASRNWRRLIRGCGGNGSFNDKKRSTNISYCINFLNNGAIEWWESIISVNIYPLSVIRTESGGYLPTVDKLRIVSDYGFRYSDYIWQYSIDGHYFNDLPAFNGQSTIDINAYDIFGENVDEYIGRTIYFRQRSVCDTYPRTHYSNVVHFSIKKSLPILTNSNNETIFTRCYGDKADYVLHFDRPLDSDEKINFSLVPNPNSDSLINISQLERGNTFTLRNLPVDDYKLRIGGRNGGNSYSKYGNEDFKFSIKNPSRVTFRASGINPSCPNANNGEISILAFGGTNQNYKIRLNNGEWLEFSESHKHIIKNLPQGIYTIRVKDGNDCIGKDNGNEQTSIPLIAPRPITITYPSEEQKRPQFPQATNGRIMAVVQGGTPYNGANRYRFSWKRGTEEITRLATTHYDHMEDKFYISLENIPQGDYYLSVMDSRYDPSDSQKANCAVLNSFFKLEDSPALQATLSLQKPISCNRGNEFGNERDREMDGQRDESQDGILQIRAQGGTPFTGTVNGGRPYKYTWKKQNPNGSWQLLPFEGDTAMNLSQGRYAINIEDANGIKLGRYNTHTNTLEALTDVVYELREPDPLTLSLEKTDATCRGNDGKITAVPTGGTPPYRYLWSNGATTASVENLLPMPYSVEIKDRAGCVVQGNTAILQPNNLTISGAITPLRCHNATDASIVLTIQGGTAPYQYLWNTGATIANINNLSAGEYRVKVTDAQGCAHFKNFTIENPLKFEINLGGNRTLCNGQTLTLNTAINDSQATYLWRGDNGFSSNAPEVTLRESGTYTATVTTKDGCVASDTLTIEVANTPIASEFLLTTQSYENEEVVLVNTSNPKGETTQWLVPEKETIEITKQNDDYISLIFKEKGEYRIGIKQTQGNCYELFYKNIIVEPATDLPKTQRTNEAFVREFEVAPNPNNGKFKAKVVLEKAGAIKFRLYSITGQLIMHKSLPSAEEHWVDFQDPLPAATYILVLETPYQRLSKKIIIIP